MYRKHSIRANQPSEYRHHGHHVLNAHRRDISCLDIVKGAAKIVASGSKDRKIVIWCLQVKIETNHKSKQKSH